MTRRDFITAIASIAAISDVGALGIDTKEFAVGCKQEGFFMEKATIITAPESLNTPVKVADWLTSLGYSPSDRKLFLNKGYKTSSTTNTLCFVFKNYNGLSAWGMMSFNKFANGQVEYSTSTTTYGADYCPKGTQFYVIDF